MYLVSCTQTATLAAHTQKLSSHNTTEKINGCYLITKTTFYTEDKYTSVVTTETWNGLYMFY